MVNLLTPNNNNNTVVWTVWCVGRCCCCCCFSLDLHGSPFFWCCSSDIELRSDIVHIVTWFVHYSVIYAMPTRCLFIVWCCFTMSLPHHFKRCFSPLTVWFMLAFNSRTESSEKKEVYNIKIYSISSCHFLPPQSSSSSLLKVVRTQLFCLLVLPYYMVSKDEYISLQIKNSLYTTYLS